MYARDGKGGTSLDALDALRPMKREVIVLGVPSDAKSLQPRFFLYPATRGGAVQMARIALSVDEREHVTIEFSS